jgi:hypothetical protein
MTSLPPPPAIPPPPGEYSGRIVGAKYVTVRVNGVDSLAKFIDDLQLARSDSKHTGGTYSAFLLLANGQKLQVEIALPFTSEDSK